MKKAAIAAVCAALISTAAEAGEWTFEAMGKARTLFGYGHPDSRYSYHRSRYIYRRVSTSACWRNTVLTIPISLEPTLIWPMVLISS